MWQAQVWRVVLCGRSLVKQFILKTTCNGNFSRFILPFLSSNQDTEHKCTIICGYKLNCGLHRCQEVCHRGNCQPCWQTSEYSNPLLLPLFLGQEVNHYIWLFDLGFDELTCYCGETVMFPPIPCGTKPPECKNPCTRQHDCDHPGIFVILTLLFSA